MNRRNFLATSSAAAATALAASGSHALAQTNSPSGLTLDLTRHRFGVNYTPSRNWWFCWNDWDSDPIRRDLDAIAALGADHLRLMLIWPFFQPNPTWVSPAHLDRLNQLLALMEERHLDALITVFTGQLSGWYFLPSFNRLSDGFYTDATMRSAQQLFVRELARVMKQHANIIGFDFGNELNTSWNAPIPEGDHWMANMFDLMNQLLPAGLHDNGVDHHPWF